MKDKKRVCHLCRKEYIDDKYYPFCSERCKEIDLLNWLEEKYKIERPLSEEELEDERSKS